MKKHRSRLLVSFIAVLVLALALAACGGGEEPTPTPEPPPPTAVPEPTDVPEPTAEPTAVPEPTDEPEPTAVPEPTAEPAPAVDFQEFSNDESGLTMDFPSDWVSDASFAELLVFASSEEALMADEPGATDGVALLLRGTLEDFETTDPVEAIEAFIAEMDTGGEGLREGPTAVTINGNPGATAIIVGESDSGVSLTAYLALIINSDGNGTATFIGSSPTDIEDEYLATFAAMAQSIELREPVVSEDTAESGDVAAFSDSKGFLFYGDVTEATLDEGGSDSWDFIGLEGEVIDIIVEPATGDLDVILDVRDADGVSVLEFPIDDSFGIEELLGFEVPASTSYFIVIESYDGAIGDYTVTLVESGTTPVTDDPGSGESGDAVSIAPGSAIVFSEIYNSSVSGDEAATFTFTGKAGEFADISVSPTTEGLDVIVDFLDPSGVSLLDAPLDDSYDSEYIRVFRMLEDGEYTVVITSYDGSPGDIEVLVEESYLSNPASFIFASSSIDDAEEVHDFPFYTSADELVVIQVKPDIEFDAVIQVFNDDTGEMLKEEDASTGFEEIVFFAPEDGNYSFRVIGYEGSTGTYDINLIGSETVYFEIAVGDLVIGRFGDNNLFEYYIGGEAGDVINITAKTEDDVDLVLELVDFDDNTLVAQDDGLSAEAESFTYTFAEDGLLILRVSNFYETGMGEFTLTVE